jgi:RNA polymerase sigma-70 factor (ECF subfamily)
MRTKPVTDRPHAEVIPLRRAESDAALVAALRARAPGAGHALFAAYGEHVRRVLLRVMGPDGELGDIAQDVFVVALESIGKLQNPEALRGWLAQIAVFQARGQLRRRKQWRIVRFFAPAEDEPASERALDVDVETSAALRAAYRVLGKLAVDERIAFALRFIEGMELTEVAAACNVSLSTIKRRIGSAEAAFAKLAAVEPALTEWMGGRP